MNRPIGLNTSAVRGRRAGGRRRRTQLGSRGYAHRPRPSRQVVPGGVRQVGVLGVGTPVSVRPLVAADRAWFAEWIAALSDRSKYRRFFSCPAELPARMLDRLVDDVDGVQHVAFVATVPAEIGFQLRSAVLAGRADRPGGGRAFHPAAQRRRHCGGRLHGHRRLAATRRRHPAHGDPRHRRARARRQHLHRHRAGREPSVAPASPEGRASHPPGSERLRSRSRRRVGRFHPAPSTARSQRVLTVRGRADTTRRTGQP